MITRTLPGANTTAQMVRTLGFEPIIVPAAHIEYTPKDIDLDGVQALLMTSAAAARALVMTQALQVIPLYAVGDATAQAAISAGFQNVISAGGDGANLAVLAADRLNPRNGALVHVRGREVAGDVTGMLQACGFEARHLEVYVTHDHPEFKPRVTDCIRSKVGYVLIHSPAGARRFCAAVTNPKLDLSGWNVVGMSQACLKLLDNLNFKSFIRADSPDDAALHAALVHHYEHQGLE
ncbi:hypothetical protein PsB1_1350 [Candidatus Phycosocius spiralis]|uniref:Tetrapyrrole biosynthesis uroporphyrinogen III synthase domain-containing protein n=1 Tax=Candidatus Phycosocius spiralis TaxID=2815099 RepID=A0ABQ4PVX9_9PROT|nr:hypothetical protein PsB1_1350 [Candidatus Phycosocius spiralis]